MPKLKSNRGAAKRFAVLKSGTIKRKRAYHSHILTTKTSKQKRRLRRGTVVNARDKKLVLSMLPYG